MQRLDRLLQTSEQTHPPEHPRSSAVSRSALFTVTTIAGIAGALVRKSIEPEQTQQSFAMIPAEYIAPAPDHIHSGPFEVPGCAQPLVFLEDGFTLKVGRDKFRVANVRALFSDLTLPHVQSILYPDGVTSIECDGDLVMRSGSQRSLRIAATDLASLLQTMIADPGPTMVTVTGIPYELEMENAISTLFIRRKGECSMTFQKLPNKTDMMLAADTH